MWVSLVTDAPLTVSVISFHVVSLAHMFRSQFCEAGVV